METTQTEIQIPSLPQTPLEKLCSRKRELKTLSKEYEQSIAADVNFLQDHAGSMLLSGVTSMVFPKSGKDNCHKKASGKEPGDFTIMSLAKSFILPAALSLAQPIILSWGLGKVPTWILNFVIKKMKKK